MMELALRQSGSAAALRATKKASAQGAKEGSYIGDVQVGCRGLHAAHASLQQLCVPHIDAMRRARSEGFVTPYSSPCLCWSLEPFISPLAG